MTFVHNHAQAIVACDFFIVFTARFRILYVLVIMELGRRRILHHNVTERPNAEWTPQQFREALTEEHSYRFLIHDRDSIFSKDLDKAVTAMGVRILKAPVLAPKANAICERLVATIRRECPGHILRSKASARRITSQLPAGEGGVRLESSFYGQQRIQGIHDAPSFANT
jgi:putative transposase